MLEDRVAELTSLGGRGQGDATRASEACGRPPATCSTCTISPAKSASSYRRPTDLVEETVAAERYTEPISSLLGDSDCGVAQYLSRYGALLVLGNLIPIEIEHKKANG
jgi:hypothetical protein